MQGRGAGFRGMSGVVWVATPLRKYCGPQYPPPKIYVKAKWTNLRATREAGAVETQSNASGFLVAPLVPRTMKV